MGSKHSQNGTNKKDKGMLKNFIKKLVTRNHFEFMYVIGKGGFGKVNNNIIYSSIRYGKFLQRSIKECLH
jgi:hypothetical protein